jgi:hypothetical protein
MTHNNTLPPIYFYIPQADWQDSKMPETADTYWSGFGGNITSGVYAWTIQTYLRLKENGFPCELTGILPTEGIVLAHRYSLPFHLRPGAKLLIVCLKADKDRHPYAQLHVVLNAEETKTLRDSYYMPHWPQPGLIPRDRERGDRFENIAYFGAEENLAPELKDPLWQEQINALGLRWHIVNEPELWHDFSYVDAILAVRCFKREYTSKLKPASKLYNSWLAGVPAILGWERGFQAERQSDLDYLEVTSVNEAIEALKRLRDDTELRTSIVENGKIRSSENTVDQLVNRWQNFILDVAVPAYDRWCNQSSFKQQITLSRRYLDIKENSWLKPNPVYPHDADLADRYQMGITLLRTISLMQFYRNVKRLIM